MKIYNIQDNKDTNNITNSYDMSNMDLMEDCQKVNPVYAEVLRIFRNAFSYIDISKIIKNL
ncbi:MAG: hypothetical protein QM654_03015 [Dysgonamonadaceae bacterium]